MKQFSIKDTYTHPVKMAIVVVVLMLFCQLLFVLIKPLIPNLIDERSPHVVTIAMLLFYILFNSISTFSSKSLARHWGRSMYGLMLIGGLGYLIAYLISGKSLRELDGFRDIIIIVLIGFFALKSIATSIKGIVLFTKYRDSLKK